MHTLPHAPLPPVAACSCGGQVRAGVRPPVYGRVGASAGSTPSCAQRRPASGWQLVGVTLPLLPATAPSGNTHCACDNTSVCADYYVVRGQRGQRRT